MLKTKTNSSHLVVLLFSSLLLFIHVSSQQKPLALDCGSQGGRDEDGRTWDTDEEFLLSSASSKQVEAGFQDPSLLSSVPYTSVRILPTQATYQFPINSTSHYIIRLHFYPSTYLQYDVRDSYFSVTANNNITLLTNFSAALTCQALTQAFLIREYALIPLHTDKLSLTFTPSPDHPRSFAFVNGIEVVLVPDGMFKSVDVVGLIQDHAAADAHSRSLQLMYRLNVAGQYISPTNDSGNLFRRWYNDMPYLYGKGSGGIDIRAPPDFVIKYTVWPESSAPPDVYKTCRQMGPDPKVNKQSNLTWMFHVDPGFMYLIRLHFCEFLMNKVNQKVFNIYINNQPASVFPKPFDILQYTNQKGVAMFHDYVIFVDDDDKKEDATFKVDMFPAVDSHPQFLDAQLNGLEIFKMSDPRKGLVGPNPEPSAMLAQAEIERKRVFETNSTHVFITGGVIAVFGLITAIGLVACTRKGDIDRTDSNASSWLQVHTGMTGMSNSGNLSTLAQGQCRNFSLAEMKDVTKNFSESNVIGVGGFGKVYKGVLDDGMKVAIKRSNPQSEQGVNEFETEICMLSKLRHKHLVALIGFCEDEGEMCLVYDYMEMGTLREHLYSSQESNLSWKQRLETCIGAAKGLHYLHKGAKYTIIHRDVKTTNILLDENFVAKVSDFGLSKTGPKTNQGHVSTLVKGSFGYLDPEYFKRQQLTEKSDVYSFGVVLFEVLSGRPALNLKLPMEQVSLADWALMCQRKGKIEDLIDPRLKGKISRECLKKFADTAEKCLLEHGINRPTMGDVLWNLEFALHLEETSHFTIHGSTVSRDSGSEEEQDDSGNDPTFSQGR